MHQILNTLYVLTQRAYLHLDHDTVKVKVEGETRLQVPLHHLGAVCCVGDVATSTALLHRCADDGRAVVFLDHGGRFKGRLEGPVSGNVLLRRAQHQALSDPALALRIARHVVAGKVQNARQVLLRGAREAMVPEDEPPLQEAARHLAESLPRVEAAPDLDTLRGVEGDAARAYFAVFSRLVKEDRATFRFEGRSRRPPRDPMNGLLSFVYTLLLSDCVAAAEGVGMDPQVGYLHALRPGRPALALDLMEELRAVLADRLALTLVNRRQLSAKDFEQREGGAWSLTETGRRAVVTAYQQRKQEEVLHPVAEQRVPLGLVPHVQARLLARHLRGDLECYPPFLYR
jgi:CRISPR-associated protein Cas1